MIVAPFPFMNSHLDVCRYDDAGKATARPMEMSHIRKVAKQTEVPHGITIFPKIYVRIYGSVFNGFNTQWRKWSKKDM